MTRAALLWFGVLAAPLAWVVQLLAGYAVEEAACSTGTGDFPPVLESGAESTIAVISVVAALVAVAGAIASLAGWRAVSKEGEADPRGRFAFMAGFGLLASLIFLAVIVLGGIALVPLDVCHPG